MIWHHVQRGDAVARDLADRHYNRQNVGAAMFMPPGRAVVLTAITDTGRAVWGSSWPFAEYVLHKWAGAWVNSLFRNEGAGLSSELITQAVAVTRYVWGEPPDLGMVTFVDRSKVRHKRDPGRCYLRAGFAVVGETKGGLLALGLPPERMPNPCPPIGEQITMEV